MGVYTHINLHDQSSAIESLPAPPSVKINGKDKSKQSKGAVAELGQLGAMWGNLSEDFKGRILALANISSSEG
jgi:hypothetical protein